MEKKRRHNVFYQLLWIFSHRTLARKFNYDFENIKVDYSPYIVVSNHVTNWDPLLIGLSFKKFMYYVATDQVFRMGWKTKVLNFVFAPIPRSKTTQETKTVISIFRRLNENSNICIFAEGSTSFDGETCEIQPSIGKLVKRAGVALVTYRFTGSYLTFPRWARFVHKGKMEGRLVNIYSPEKIASMTEDEIYEAIVKDIYVSAYAEQEKNPIPFRGKNPAEYLETVLYCCPKCKQYGTLSSSDDLLSCNCGFKVRYNDYCYFEIPDGNGEPPFKTVTDWAKWQRNEIAALSVSMKNLDRSVPVFTEEDQRLIQIEKTYGSAFIAEGKLCLFNDRLSLIAQDKTVEFPFDTIIDMSSFARMTLIFSTKENKVYELYSKHPRSALKYMDMLKAVKTNTEE